MAVATDGPAIPDNEALLRRAMATDTLAKVGPMALRNYYAGRRVVAHFMLHRQRAKGAQSDLVDGMLADAFLWIDPPPGVRPPGPLRDDNLGLVAGFPVKTLWSTVARIPVKPVRNFLVRSSLASAGRDEPPGDVIVAEIPLTAVQRSRGARREAGLAFGVIAGIASLVVGFFPHTVSVYNGFPVPIHVEVNGDPLTVHPDGVDTRSILGWRLHLHATAVPTAGQTAAVIDDRDVTFRWNDDLVYTPGKQAALAVEDVVYGEGKAADPTFLPLEVVQSVHADYVLREPPQSIQLDQGQNAHRAHVLNVLSLADYRSANERVAFVARRYGRTAAIAMIDDSLAVAPDQIYLAMCKDWSLGQGRRAFWADLRQRAPDAFPIWRRYGEVVADRAAFLAAARKAAEAGDENAVAIVALYAPDPAESLALSPSKPLPAVAGAILTDDVRERRYSQAEARADALTRLGRWSDAVSAWDDYLALQGSDEGMGRREQARARRLGHLPDGDPPKEASADEIRLLTDTATVTEHPDQADAVVAATTTYQDPAFARYVLALARGRAGEARMALNDMKGKVDDDYFAKLALIVELGGGGDPMGLRVLLGTVASVDPGWGRVAAAAAEALALPTAPAWAAEAEEDGDRGPTLADIRARAAAGPAWDAWVAWPPRAWPAASLAAAWLSGDENARAGWRALAEDEALPGDILAAPTVGPTTPWGSQR